MNNVSVGEMNVDVAVGMSGFVVFQSDVFTIQAECLLGSEDLRWKCIGWRRRERKRPALDASRCGQVLAGVLMGENSRPNRCDRNASEN